MTMIPHSKPTVPDAPVMHPGQVTPNVPNPVHYASTLERLAVVLGVRPDPRLIAAGLIPTRVGRLRWSWETSAQAAARQAAARRAMELRKAAAELAPRVESLKLALAPVVGLQPHELDLRVPVEFKKADADPVWLAIPDGWAGQKEAVTGIIAERLGGEWVVTWHMTKHPHHVTMKKATKKPSPPDRVEWELSTDRYSIFVGRTGTEKVYVKTETETPHWGVSAGTGGGKSTTLTLPALHYRAYGGLVDIIDLKQDSFKESLEGVSGFRIHTDVISAVTAMAEFLVSAKSITIARERGYPVDTIPSRVLLIDEFGSLVSAAESWWKFGVQEKGTPPLFAWFHMILMQGRTKDHRVVVGTHDFSVATFKGTGPRDLIGSKLLLGAISNPKWITTFGYDYKRPDFNAKHPGRGVIGIPGSGVEVLQIAYISKEDTRAMCSEFAPAPEWFDAGEMAPWISDESIEMTHREAHIRGFLKGGEYVTYPDIPADQPDAITPGQAVQAGTSPHGLHLVLTPEQEAERQARELVGLREALEAGYLMPLIREANYRNQGADSARLVDLALNVMRKARKDDGGFPASVGQRGQEKLYTVRDLQLWEAQRPSKMDFDTDSVAAAAEGE